MGDNTLHYLRGDCNRIRVTIQTKNLARESLRRVMDQDLILAIAGLAAFFMFYLNDFNNVNNGNSQGNGQVNHQLVARRPKRVWQRGILRRRTKKSQFYTIMQELNDGNVTFCILLLTCNE